MSNFVIRKMVEESRIVCLEFILERELGEIVVPNADAQRHIFETPTFLVAESPCWSSRAIRLLALVIIHSLAYRALRYQVNAIIFFYKYLFYDIESIQPRNMK